MNFKKKNSIVSQAKFSFYLDILIWGLNEGIHEFLH